MTATQWCLFAMLGVAMSQDSSGGVQLPQIVNEIVVYPPVLKMGQTASLRCYVANKNTATLMWSKSSAMSTISVNERIVVDENKMRIDGIDKYTVDYYKEGNVEIFELKIHRLQLTDSGNYTCAVYISGGQHQHGTLPRRTAELVVVVPPRIDRARTLSVVNGVLGANAVLRCYADGIPMPNVTWERLNGVQFKDGNQIIRGNELEIKNVDRNDRGVYRCSARNNVDSEDPLVAQFDVRFNVQFGAEATALDSQVGQAENKHYPAYLECKVGGNPAPELYWVKLKEAPNEISYNVLNADSEDIDNDYALLMGTNCSDNYTVERRILHSDIYQLTISQHGLDFAENEVLLKLRIDNVRGLDYGTYACIARNAIGASCDRILLFQTADCQSKECPDLSMQYAPKAFASAYYGSASSGLVASLKITFFSFFFYLCNC